VLTAYGQYHHGLSDAKRLLLQLQASSPQFVTFIQVCQPASIPVSGVSSDTLILCFVTFYFVLFFYFIFITFIYLPVVLCDFVSYFVYDYNIK